MPLGLLVSFFLLYQQLFPANLNPVPYYDNETATEIVFPGAGAGEAAAEPAMPEFEGLVVSEFLTQARALGLEEEPFVKFLNRYVRFELDTYTLVEGANMAYDETSGTLPQEVRDTATRGLREANVLLAYEPHMLLRRRIVYKLCEEWRTNSKRCTFWSDARIYMQQMHQEILNAHDVLEQVQNPQ